MKKTLSLALALGCIFQFLGCITTGSSVRTTFFQPVEVNAHDSASQWVKPFNYYNDEAKAYYSFNNDLRNIYFSFKTLDKGTQLKILQTGLELWIDTAGRNSDMIGIVFPARRTYKQAFKKDTAIKKPPYTTDLNRAKIQFVKGEKLLQLTGFRPPIGGITPFRNDFGIEASVNWDSTNTAMMVVRAKIPLNTFYKYKLNLRDSNKVFGFTIKTSGLPYEVGASNGASRGAGGIGGTSLSIGMGMGMGGFGMGGMGVGMGGMGIGMGGMGYGGMNGMGYGYPMGYGRGAPQYSVPPSTLKTKFKLRTQ